jgi:ABC-type branched-subunit amino acid transport system ATPase component
VDLSEKKNHPAASLSYGQQKLLAIARLLAGGFSLLLLDEPTAGLNPVMIKNVLRLLEKIITEDPTKTVVLVEHNMGVVNEVADWVYFMNEGRIAFFGRTDHVLGDKEVREIYLGL